MLVSRLTLFACLGLRSLNVSLLTDILYVFSFLLTELGVAYNHPFIGHAAIDFVDFLHRTDENIRYNNVAVYAKAISVIQSSGTGKSRMLTEVRSCSIGTI